MATEAPAPAPLTPLEVAVDRLAAYMRAEREILAVQQYQVGDGAEARMVLRARLAEVQAGIKDARAQIALLSAPTRGSRIAYLR